jgi:hypothetical protein
MEAVVARFQEHERSLQPLRLALRDLDQEGWYAALMADSR